jgi:hypothetical protein
MIKQFLRKFLGIDVLLEGLTQEQQARKDLERWCVEQFAITPTLSDAKICSGIYKEILPPYLNESGTANRQVRVRGWQGCSPWQKRGE